MHQFFRLVKILPRITLSDKTIFFRQEFKYRSIEDTENFRNHRTNTHSLIYSYPFSDTFTIPAAASCFLSLNHCFCPQCYYILSCFCFATDDNDLKIECFFASCLSSSGTKNNQSFVISHRAISLMD